jgi:hypothetical protein
MSIKQLLCPARVRQIPAQFSWIDQRLVRDNLIGSCGADALALYLFLVTVADAQGLSYYSDPSIVRRLTCFDSVRLAQARTELKCVGWIAYKPPLYQVLALDAPERSGDPGRTFPIPPKPPVLRRTAQPVAVIQLLRQALEGHHDQL